MQSYPIPEKVQEITWQQLEPAAATYEEISTSQLADPDWPKILEHDLLCVLVYHKGGRNSIDFKKIDGPKYKHLKVSTPAIGAAAAPRNIETKRRSEARKPDTHIKNHPSYFIYQGGGRGTPTMNSCSRTSNIYDLQHRHGNRWGWTQEEWKMD